MINGGVKEKNVFVSVAGKSAAAVGAAGKGAVKRKKKCRNLHPDTLNGASFKHFLQDIFAYFS